MSLPTPDPEFFERRFQRVCRMLMRYHRFEATGLEHIPVEGPALIVGTHSMVTYDNFMAISAIYDRTGRVVRGLADNFWWQSEKLGDWVNRMGAVRAEPGATRALLEAGELVAVAPGGMAEALKPSTERFQTKWGKRRGFVRLAIETGVPIVLAACPGADLAMTIYDNPISAAIYDKWRQPFFLARGFGPTLLPRPVRMRYHFRAPIDPGLAGEVTPERVETLFEVLDAKMKSFVASAVVEDGLTAHVP